LASSHRVPWLSAVVASSLLPSRRLGLRLFLPWEGESHCHRVLPQWWSPATSHSHSVCGWVRAP